MRDNPNQDLSGLNRNPTLDNQALAPIFDAQKVQEKLEMGQVAGQVGMTAAGDLAAKMGWAEGSTERTILHGVVGAGIAALGGGDALQGALGASANQLVIQKMAEYLESLGYTPDSPEFATMLKLASTAVGAAVGGSTGAATALDGTTFNYLNHQQLVDLQNEIKRCSGDRVCIETAKSNAEILSEDQEQTLVRACEANRFNCANNYRDGISDAINYINDPLAGQLGLQVDQTITLADYLNHRSEWGLVAADNGANSVGKLMFLPPAIAASLAAGPLIAGSATAIGATSGAASGYVAGGWQGALIGAGTGAVTGRFGGVTSDLLGGQIGGMTGMLVGTASFVGIGSGAGAASTIATNYALGHEWNQGVYYGAAVGAFAPLASGEAFAVGAGGELIMTARAANAFGAYTGLWSIAGGAMTPPDDTSAGNTQPTSSSNNDTGH